MRAKNRTEEKPFGVWHHEKGMSAGFAGFLRIVWLAYRKSAQVLYAALPQSDEPHDLLVASPMVFLYRHAAEAYIAAIVCVFGHEVGTSRKEAVALKHKIKSISATSENGDPPPYHWKILGFIDIRTETAMSTEAAARRLREIRG